MAVPVPTVLASQSFTERFMPHGMCYLWEPGLLWLHVLSDALVGLAYVAISFSLAWFVWLALRERADRTEELRPLPFWWMFLAFGLFIVACGGTHFMAVWTVWNPDYWASGSLKAATALVSVATAVALPPLVPRARDILRKARASERRRKELSTAHARIKELDQEKTRFFANMSHELRTPLSLIRGPVERLRDTGRLAPEDAELLDVVLRNAHLLEKRVDDLLEVTRLEAGAGRAEKGLLDLGELTESLAGHFAPAARNRGVELTVDVKGSTWIRGSRDQWERIVMNLVSNALKFTADGTDVRVGVEGVGAHRGETEAGGRDVVLLSVRDQGPGIPPASREAVFEPFRRLDDSDSRRYGGYGLGLAIVRQLVELHGGTVRAEEAPGGGALFVTEVPAARLPHVDDAADRKDPGDAEGPGEGPRGLQGALTDLGASRTTRGAPSAAAATEDPGQATVLVVEDNRDLAGHLLSVLPAEARGVVAQNGREALELLDRIRPDVILSDVMMPEMDGAELLRTIRARDGMHDIPVIFLTARRDEALKVELLRAGAQDFLTKPFVNEEVEARLGTWLSVSRARRMLREEVDLAESGLEALVNELVTRGRELEAALDTARVAREEEARASRAKTEFLGMMSHELRTPINAIIGYAGLLEEEIDGPLNDAQKTRLERLQSNAGHLLEMVDDVLRFTSVEKGVRVEQASLEIAPFVTRVMETVEGPARKKGLELGVEVQGPDTVWTDATRLRQILLNLLNNGIRYTEEGSVRLVVDEVDAAAVHDPRGVVPAAGRMVRFRVRDSGPGIPEDEQSLIFEAFWRGKAHQPRTEDGGAGLGLAISRRLARRLGGEITVVSRPGEGSTFTLVLPLASVSPVSPEDPRDPTLRA